MRFLDLVMPLATSIRFGHATNSSSSHSIVLLNDHEFASLRERAQNLQPPPPRGAHNYTVPDIQIVDDKEEPDDEYDNDDKPSEMSEVPADGTYGWSWFALTSRDEKLAYLWSNLHQQVEGLLRPVTYVSPWSLAGYPQHGSPDFDRQHQAAQDVSRRLAGSIINLDFVRRFTTFLLDFEPEKARAHALSALGITHEEVDFEPNLDHDSAFSLPLDPNTRLPHVGFGRWFRDRVLRENVAVLGGNDNAESPVNWPKGHGQDLRAPLRDDEHTQPMTCFDRGDHWLLYDREVAMKGDRDAVKLRVPKEDGAAIPFSSVPELVDIKVTSQCGMGCRYCYQGSKAGDPHSEMPAHNMADFVASLGVLEAAIGGGEPLEWPPFWDFVTKLREKHVVPNVTTRRLDLISETNLTKLGAVGYSVDKYETARAEMERLQLLDTDARGGWYSNPWAHKLVMHIVLGSTTTSELVRLCQLAKDAHVGVLLLGYKTDGRGSAFKPKAHDDWISALKDAFWKTSKYGKCWEGPRLGVDTPIVEKWGNRLKTDLQVDPRLMTAREGAFSLYVDFVDMTVSKASYGAGGYGVDGTGRVPLDVPVDKIRGKAKLETKPNWYTFGQTGPKQVLDVFRSWNAKAD